MEEEPSTVRAVLNFTAKDMKSLRQSRIPTFKGISEVSVRESHRVSMSITPPASISIHHSEDFTSCTARFSGAPGDSLDNFLDAVESYKESACIGDDYAFQGLPMLLTGDALAWWQGLKGPTSWSEVVTSLRCEFGDSYQPHRIYMELFSMSQGYLEKTDIFIAKARALLVRLPPGDISEKVQLDMLYGLLYPRVRKRLRRNEFNSFDTLLLKAGLIEDAALADKNHPRSPNNELSAYNVMRCSDGAVSPVTHSVTIPETQTAMTDGSEKAMNIDSEVHIWDIYPL